MPCSFNFQNLKASNLVIRDSSEVNKSLNEIRFRGWTEDDYMDNDYYSALRQYIDDSNSGKIEDECLSENSSLVKGPFVIYYVEESILGGLDVYFVFLDACKTVFSSWIYSQVDAITEEVMDYKVMSFLKHDEPTSFQNKEEILTILKQNSGIKTW